MLRDLLERQEEKTTAIEFNWLHCTPQRTEFPYVFLIGCEENILPHRNSIESDNIEEERRLAYVGVTRAMRELKITYCNSRRMGGEKVETSPSRFLEELPDEHIFWEGKTLVSESKSAPKANPPWPVYSPLLIKRWHKKAEETGLFE